MYNPTTAAEICRRIAEGESLRSICLTEGMPSKTTVLRWLQETDKAVFRDQYARARESQAEHFLDEIIEISDNCTDDVELIKSSSEGDRDAIRHSAIQRARLQVDTRKWAMSKMAPKKYGEKLQTENRNVDKDGNDITPKTDHELNARLAEILVKVGTGRAPTDS